jgi:DNA-binding transcriptional LysR family regulator
VAPDNPLAQRPFVSLADCLPFPLLLPDETWIEQTSAGRVLMNSIRRFEIAARVDRVNLFKPLVRAGLGIAFMTAIEAEHEVRMGEVVYIPLQPRRFELPTLSLVVAIKHTAPVYTALFIENMVTRLAKLDSRMVEGSFEDRPR